MTRQPWAGYLLRAAAVAACFGLLGVAFALGGAIGTAQVTQPAAAPEASPSAAATPAATPAEPAPPAWEPVAQQVLPLALRKPITGPDRPPLPDADGPSGSRRTTGTYEVALTFDDGPDPRWTPEILHQLRAAGVRATFCVIGVNVVNHPELVQAIAADGHTLCNHSWGHDMSLGRRSPEVIADDLIRTNAAIRQAAPGARVSYFRQPGGNWTEQVVAVARSLGMSSLHWDVDPKDWARPGARSIASVVTAGTVPGSIVLLHDGGGDRRGTTEALRRLLPNLAQRLPLVAFPPGVDPPRLHGVHYPVHPGQR